MPRGTQRRATHQISGLLLDSVTSPVFRVAGEEGFPSGGEDLPEWGGAGAAGLILEFAVEKRMGCASESGDGR